MTTVRAGAPRRRALLLALTLLGAGLTAALAVWQLDRAGQKRSLQASLQERARLPALQPTELLALAAADVDARLQRRVELRGYWLAERSIYLDNRTMAGRAGFFVVTPLQLTGRDEAVLVQRGWVPRDARERSRLPALPTPAGEQRVVGLLAASPSRMFELGAAASGVIRQNLDLVAYGRETGLRLLPLAVLQTEATVPDDGLLRDWPAPAVDIHKHYGYAFQWSALSALQLGLYVWFQVIRPRRRPA